ncbi:MAG: hypothetical protein GY811_28360 [Myxococcales bacterium]|nr:hypothetical protein [Myxococcales bacterium]
MKRYLLRITTVVCVFAAVSFAARCSKSAKKDNAEPAKSTTTAAEPSKSGDLEAAIAAPGKKTVTAVGANGKTKVLEVGSIVLAETETYIVKADIPTDLASGSEATVTINLLPKTGWKINQEFPTKLKIKAPEGITVKTDTQGAKEAEKFTEKQALFKVSCSPEGAGAKEFAADFRFAVCTDATCDPKKAELAWTLNVK